MEIVGIDLAGVETRPTGFCWLNKKLKAKTKILFTDKEILMILPKDNYKKV